MGETEKRVGKNFHCCYIFFFFFFGKPEVIPKFETYDVPQV